MLCISSKQLINLAISKPHLVLKQPGYFKTSVTRARKSGIGLKTF